jgi:hypothetical protein
MLKRTFAVLALAFALFGTQCWAVTCAPEEGVSCTNTFSPGTTEGVYDFTASGNGKLTVDFVTVLTTFNLTVTVNHTIDTFDPKEFPAGTVCVQYSTNGFQCDQYDFTGSAGGPNGVPVRNIDYKGLITLTLIYFTNQPVHTPAFAHAPGDDTTTFTEDILTAYFQPVSDGGMIGHTPGLSSVGAADEPLTETDTFCGFVPPLASSYTVGQVIEVSFQLFSNSSCSGTPIRDKTAHLSLAMTNGCFGGYNSSPPLQDKEEGNKFHWDNKDGLNEFDLSTVGLPAPGTYVITLFSSKFSPQSVCFNLNPAP